MWLRSPNSVFLILIERCCKRIDAPLKLMWKIFDFARERLQKQQMRFESLRQYCSSTISVLFQYFSSTVPVLHQYYSNTVSVLFQYCSSTVPVLLQYCFSALPILFLYCTSTAPVLFQCCPNTHPSFEYEGAAERSVAGTLSLDRRLMAQPAASTRPQKKIVGRHNQHFEI